MGLDLTEVINLPHDKLRFKSQLKEMFTFNVLSQA